MVDLTLPDAVPAQDAADAAERRVVARVLAWQHSHPLARRLAAGDVGGLGVIALPYGAGAGQGATPLFHQPNLLPGLSHRALAGFAARHAVGERPGPAEWPRRDIERADAASEPAPQTRFLLTAAIADPRSALPRRLLLAPAGTAVWGRRPLDRVRTGMAGALAVAVLVLAAWALARGWGGAAVPPQTPPGAVPAQPLGAPSLRLEPAASTVVATAGGQGVSAAVADAPPIPLRPVSEAVPASAPVPGQVAATKPTPTPAPTSSPNPAPEPVIGAASFPAGAQPAAGSSPAQASAPAVPASVAPPRLLPMPGRPATATAAAPPVLVPPAASAPLAPAGPHFALVSLPSKKRADAEATLERVRDVLGPAIGNLQVQVMSSPQGFVVTLWPLPTQADAERMAEVLARRGVPMKWLEF
jgi:hypothetical protein